MYVCQHCSNYSVIVIEHGRVITHMNAYVYIHSHMEPHNVMQTLGPATRSSLPSPCNNHNLLTSWEIHCPVNQLGQPTEADCLLAIQACQLAPYSPIQLKESSQPIGTQHPSPTSTLKAQPLQASETLWKMFIL